MTTLKLHYDGWLALPAGLREKLGLKSGDRLEAELVGGTLVLRPAATARGRAGPGAKASEPPAATAPAASPVEAATPAKRKPGRPRKVQLAEAGADRVSGLPEDAPPAKRKPGRPRKVRVAEEPEPASAPASEAGEPWKLRRKTELPVAEADDEPAVAPARRPERVAFDTGYEREERHPFRQVEVRKLGGPGRGHNRGRQKALG
jgi:AbrB family looped-hinge helix DNA binding protein